MYGAWFTRQTCDSNRDHSLHKGDYHCMADLLFYCLDSAVLHMLNQQQIYLFGQIQTSQTRGQSYSDTSPYDEMEYSLAQSKWVLSSVTNKKYFANPQ